MQAGVTAVKVVGAGLVLVAVVAGCSSQPAAASGSESGCYQFAVRAIQQHVTESATPAVCRGLSAVDVNVAVSRALRAEAAGVRGLPQRRKVIDQDIRYVVGMERAASGQTASGQTGAAAPQSSPPSRAALSLAALVTWLITVGLGMSMMARWITRTLRRDARRGRVRWPVRNFVHAGLALTGLLVWISYLAAGVTALAWIACGLLLVVASLGMTLVFPVEAASPDGPGGDPRPAGPPALVTAVHIIAACVTILLAVLAAIGPG